MFSKDRDLLIYEPCLFTEIEFVSQKLIKASGGCFNGLHLVSNSSDFESTCISAGNVVVFDDLVYEVTERVDIHTLKLSVIRKDDSQAAIPGKAVSNLNFKINTFSPQANSVHNHLISILSNNCNDISSVFNEDEISSKQVIRKLEILGTLERIFTGAILIDGTCLMWRDKADYYKHAYREMLIKARVTINASGKSINKRLGSVSMSRV